MQISEYVSLPGAVDWNQGMLLSPQHFQQQESHFESMSTHKLFVSQPHYWGLIDIEFDRDAIKNGEIKIDRLYVVLPDGEVLDFNGEERGKQLYIKLGADDGKHFSEKDELLISVGAVRRNFNASGAVGRIEKRYESVSCEDVVDENNSDQTIDLCRKQLQPRLFALNEVPSRYTSVPLFKIKRTAKSVYELTSYHPPLLDFRVSKKLLAENSLHSQINALLSEMRSKARLLAEKSTSDLVELNTVSALMRKLPALEVLLETRMMHPFQIYLAFVDLITNFELLHAKRSLDPDEQNSWLRFDGYQHDDIEPAFRNYIRDIKDDVAKIKMDFQTLAFDEHERGEFQITLPAPDRIRHLFVELVPREGQDPRLVQNWFEQALIGSHGRLPRLRNQRVPGANRSALTGTQRANFSLPARANMMQIGNAEYSDLQGGYKAITLKEDLCIHGDAEDAPAAIFFYDMNEPR